ncbi:MAG: PD40 domain-containing protein, partial [Phycisphaerales bacterium]
DGRYVAYGRITDTVSQHEDIFLIPLDNGPEIPLVESPADNDVLAWMPDGKNLLFRSDRRGQGDDAWMIRVVDGRPQGVPRLVKKGIPRNLEGPVRTPTGGWAFYYREWGPYVLMSNTYTATLDPDTGKLSTDPKLVSPSIAVWERVLSPDFSHDGKYLAYYVAPAAERSPEGSQYGPGNIIIRSLETGQEREISLSPRFSDSGSPFLRWACDGRSILIAGSVETGHRGIFRVDTDTGKLNPVVLDDPGRTTPNWQLRRRSDPDWTGGDGVGYGEESLDGKTLFFPRFHFDPNAPGLHRHTQCRIVARDLDTGRERDIYRNPDGVFGVLAFNVSPDGQRVLVGTGNALWICPTTGGEPRELLKFEGEFSKRIRWQVAWTPDSRYLLFAKADQGRSELWRIAVKGGKPERVDELPLHLGTYLHPLRIHPHGRQIAFALPPTQWVAQRQIRMMKIVFPPEWAKEACIANLKVIGEALERYKNDHSDVPDWLSDLYPDCLRDESVLLCPSDERGGRSYGLLTDPKMSCSYTYMFVPRPQGVSGLEVALPVDFPYAGSMTWKDACKLQLKYYGGIVPIVQCRHHSPRISLGYNGEIIEARSWEDQAGTGLLNQLKAAMQATPAAWAQQYDMQRFLCLLRVTEDAETDEAALVKLLEMHIKEHPDDEAATEFLAELPKLRFIGRSEDDAEEDVDTGAMDLDSSDLELIDEYDGDGDQIVGLRFADIRISQGARIKRAYVQFTAYPVQGSSEKTDLMIHAELSANAETFKEADHNISTRKRTKASVKWSPEPWTVKGERSEKQRTPDMSPLIQQVVDQSNWQEGNALVLIISGSGRRTAESWDGGWSGTPMLHVEY